MTPRLAHDGTGVHEGTRTEWLLSAARLLSWVLGAASAIAAWRTPEALRWLLVSPLMIVGEGLLSMAFLWPPSTIMFIEGHAVHSPEVLRPAAAEFRRMHW